ncbi:MAG: hypothetical protein Q7T76_14900 [Ferruginibacter sp.]|nr:hypothetical protein [Ferruginibacter sp.]
MVITSFKTREWMGVALVNLCIVALAGITLRYKINFSLPFVDQKFLLHAHSHFAFTGWVALALMALMIDYLQTAGLVTDYRKYTRLLVANCLLAYGMLISFALQGYAAFSIAFSTLTIFVSYLFINYYWRDLNRLADPSYAPHWFRAGLVTWAVSSLGAFTLAFLMARHIRVQDYYFGAVYFFLHFQYNGWFLFACFGLLFSFLHKAGFQLSPATHKKLFGVMVITVAPTYFLSILWLKLPKSLHLIADLSAIFQLLVLIFVTRIFVVIKKRRDARLAPLTNYLWGMAFISFVLKIILQLLSIIPFLSSYAFGFRPIVIGYLHLSFLGIISFFILGYINQVWCGVKNGLSRTGVILFTIGVLAQEIILMMQGLEVMELEALPYANQWLLAAALLMGIGLIWIAIKFNNLKKRRQHETSANFPV